MAQGPGSESGLDMTQQKGQLHTKLARRGASASTGEGVASHAGGPFLPGPTLSPDQRIHMPGQGGMSRQRPFNIEIISKFSP